MLLPYILGQLEHGSQLDLVWDSYVADSLKATTRTNTEKVYINVLLTLQSALMPGNWQDFLHVDLNKKELFSFLSKAFVESFQQDKK